MIRGCTLNDPVNNANLIGINLDQSFWLKCLLGSIKLNLQGSALTLTTDTMVRLAIYVDTEEQRVSDIPIKAGSGKGVLTSSQVLCSLCQ